MKNIWKKILCVLLILVMGVEAGPTYQVMAASKLTGSQKKVYRKCLEKYIKNVDDWGTFESDDFSANDIKKNTVFALEDVNFDGKKELLIRTEINAYNQGGAVYKSNGKVPAVKVYDSFAGALRHGDDHSCFIFLSEIAKKGYKVNEDYGPGGWTDTYYTVTAKGTIVEYAKVDYSFGGADYSLQGDYFVKGKHASKTQFNKAVKKLGTFKKIKYHKYTAGNLKKYL